MRHVMTLAIALACLSSSGAKAADIPKANGSDKTETSIGNGVIRLEDTPVRMTVVKQDLVKVLDLLSEQIQTRIVLTKGLAGTVTNLRVDGSARSALDAIAYQAGAVWWWNGSEVRMSGRNEVASRNMKVRDVDYVIDSAKKLGLPTDLLSVTKLSPRGMARVSGPTALLTDFETLNEELSAQLGSVSVISYGKKRRLKIE